jgi:hypothetical protein
MFKPKAVRVCGSSANSRFPAQRAKNTQKRAQQLWQQCNAKQQCLCMLTSLQVELPRCSPLPARAQEGLQLVHDRLVLTAALRCASATSGASLGAPLPWPGWKLSRDCFSGRSPAGPAWGPCPAPTREPRPCRVLFVMLVWAGMRRRRTHGGPRRHATLDVCRCTLQFAAQPSS